MQITKVETDQINKVKAPAMRLAKTYIDPDDGEIFEVELDCQSDFDQVGSDLISIKSKIKELEEMEKTSTKPQREALANVKALFKSPLDLLKAVESSIKKGMSDYVISVRGEKQQAMIEAVKSQDPNDMLRVSDMKDPAFTGIQIRNSQTVIIEDRTQIPAEYLKVDEAKVKKAAKAGVEIPGVRLIEKPTIAAIAK